MKKAVLSAGLEGVVVDKMEALPGVSRREGVRPSLSPGFVAERGGRGERLVASVPSLMDFSINGDKDMLLADASPCAPA